MVPSSLNITRFRKKPAFNKDVKRLNKRVREDLERALGEMKNELPPGRHFKKLKGCEVYTIRLCGSYRLSFEIDHDVAILRRIGPRQKFYSDY